MDAAGVFGEVVVTPMDGMIFLDVSANGFGCGVCITVSDARHLVAHLSDAIEEVDNNVQG